MSRTLTCFAAMAALGVVAPAFAQPAAAPAPADSPMAPSSTHDSAAPAPTDSATAAPSASDTSAGATAKAGLPVKDKTGVTVGEITDVKTGTDGKQVATVKMGAQTFSVATASLAVTADAATINATQAELAAMIKGS